MPIVREVSPTESVGEALAALCAEIKATNNPGVLRVPPGIYREGDLDVGALPAHLTIEGENATISGAVPLVAWMQVGDNEYEHPWTENWGVLPDPHADDSNIPGGATDIPPPGRRREIVFVDDYRMAQVLDPTELHVDSFYVDDAAGLIRLKTDREITTRNVEAAKLFSLLDIHQCNRGVTVRGIVFEKAANFHDPAVFARGSANIVLDNVQVRHCNSDGFKLGYVRGAVITRSNFSDNGHDGLCSYHAEDLVVDTCEISRNNWRGAMGGVYANGYGNKHHHGRRHLWKNVHVSGNYSTGLWVDVNNADIIIKDSFFARNLYRNIDLEANPGPILVENCILMGSRPVGQRNPAGLLISVCENVTLRNNVFWNNAPTQLLITRPTRTIRDLYTDTDYDLVLSNIHLADNMFIANEDQNLIEMQSVRTLFETSSIGDDLFAPVSSNRFLIGGVVSTEAQVREALIGTMPRTTEELRSELQSRLDSLSREQLLAALDAIGA